ncbi:MAG: purine-binding chemotaxis protein CheW [Deltaproteobacteria bacterium]|jgi:purine-binding chemotaxis protein CheW|nr:MAG: purine-binding chemotaxis protein CheW [Deltaproteobacteria bacterium]
MDKLNRYVVFTLDGRQYALHLYIVERILRIVEITPLPKAPEIVLGVVNVRGEVIPVVNIRKRFRLSEREIDLSDRLIIARTSKRTVALVVDEVAGIVESPEQKVVAAEKVLPCMDYVEGVIKLEDGLVLIHDLDTFLSLEEEKTLDAALKERESKE